MSTIPKELRAHNQWVCWRRCGKQKIPIDPHTGDPAATDNPSTWASVATALACYQSGKGLAGIGFVFSGDDPFVGIDLDDCIGGGGELAPWAAEIIQRFAPTYAERSPSGRGVKIICRGTKPRCRCKVGQVECYDSGRFFAITGEHWPGAGTTIVDCQHAVDWLCETRLTPSGAAMELLPPPTTLASVGSNGSDGSVGSVCSAGSVTAEAVIAATLPKGPGERNQQILRLARGLRFDAGMEGSTFKQLRPIVRDWHRRALPVIGTKEFDETWADFQRAWERAESPLFGDPLKAALEKAEQCQPIECAEYDSGPVRLLLAVCWHLSGRTGRFFLSTHSAAKLLNAKPMQCDRWMKMYVRDEHLVVVKRGTRYRATRYRWLEHATET